MMRFFQRLGKSLMLPVACLPIGGILMGIGYAIDPSGWGANSLLALLLIKAGGILIDNMAILFALGVAIGMSKDQEGTSALAAVISWLTVQTMLGTSVVQLIIGADAVVPDAFGKINTQFIGILCGLIAAGCYNKFYKTNMPDFLGFFAGRRFVPIMTVLVTLIVCIPLYFVWPMVYNFLVWVGESIMGLGAVSTASSTVCSSPSACITPSTACSGSVSLALTTSASSGAPSRAACRASPACIRPASSPS